MNISALFDVMRKGEIVANPAAWKHGQITANALVALYVAIAHFANLPIDPHIDNAIAGLILAATNAYFTVATSDKVGILAPKKELQAHQ